MGCVGIGWDGRGRVTDLGIEGLESVGVSLGCGARRRSGGAKGVGGSSYRVVALKLILGVGCTAEKRIVGKWVRFGGAGRVAEREFLLNERCPFAGQKQGYASTNGFGEGLWLFEGGEDEAIIEQECLPE